MDYLFVGGRYTHSLFFAHLYLEKICKALWVKKNPGNIPPFIHNLVKLSDEAGVPYSMEQKSFMVVMNNFQLEGRYPDYLNSLSKLYKEKNTGEILGQVKNLGLWLQSQL